MPSLCLFNYPEIKHKVRRNYKGQGLILKKEDSRTQQTSGIHLETIRYYEKMGLMPEPKRLANGYPRL